MLAKGGQTTLLHLEGEGGRPGDVGRGIKNRQVLPHHHCPKSFQPDPVPVTGSGRPITAEIKPSFSFFSPFPTRADAGLSVSMSSQAGFGRIISNFSAGPCTCNLILGK